MTGVPLTALCWNWNSIGIIVNIGRLEEVCSGCGPLNHCVEHVAAFDSSGGASLGLMRCHGHMASCVPAHRHMSWCWSHRAHMMSCAYLSHPGSRCMRMMYLFRLSRRACCNGADQFGIWGCLWWCLIHAINLLALNCIISCAFQCVLQQKIETPTLVEIVSINTYSSVDDHFPIIFSRSWRCKSST
jgi:hypothetical protein